MCIVVNECIDLDRMPSGSCARRALRSILRSYSSRALQFKHVGIVDCNDRANELNVRRCQSQLSTTYQVSLIHLLNRSVHASIVARSCNACDPMSCAVFHGCIGVQETKCVSNVPVQGVKCEEWSLEKIAKSQVDN